MNDGRRAVHQGPMDRRQVLGSALGAGACWALGGLGFPLSASARGTDATARAETASARRQRREAVAKGCHWIAGQQPEHGAGYFGQNNGIVALSALSVLALMATGSSDGRGPYGRQVQRGIDFLLGLVENPSHGGQFPEGYFYHPKDPSSRMHGQGFATLALATAMGTTTDARYERMRGVVVKAVQCIEQSQTATGGFGYEPNPSSDHEGSVTVTVAQGLRAASDAGVPVHEEVVKRGLYYLVRSQNPNGSFRYSVYVERSSYALTAAALSSFLLYGRYADARNEDRIRRGLDFMMDQLVTVKQQQRWYYYGNFYAAWACWQRDGDDWDPHSSGYWARWQMEMYPHILSRQSIEGWWDDHDQFEFGPLLPTAFATLTLAVPDEGIPLFQR